MAHSDGAAITFDSSVTEDLIKLLIEISEEMSASGSLLNYHSGGTYCIQATDEDPVIDPHHETRKSRFKLIALNHRLRAKLKEFGVKIPVPEDDDI